MKCLYFVLVLIVLCGVEVFCEKEKKEKKEKIPEIVIPNYLIIKGKYDETTWSKKKIMTFHDLRYSREIYNTERFKAPSPYEPDEDEVYDAAETIACASISSLDDLDEDDTDIYEDCLFLTVSTKNRTGKYPVMVHLAGHDITHEKNSNDDAHPGFLLEEDVVLVSVQYRVGPFGFLCADSPDTPANVGILDVIEALRWIQKYISYFGGDPNRVTLFGQYHSAAIIHILTLTPLLEKEILFHKVIYQSGSALMPGLVTQKTGYLAKQISNNLKCENDENGIIDCLKEATAYDLLKAYQKVVDSLEEYPPLICVSEGGVLPDNPQNLLKKRKYRSYPAIGGVVQQPSVCSLKGVKTAFAFEKVTSKKADDETKEETNEVVKGKKPHNATFQEKLAVTSNIIKDLLVLEVPVNINQAGYIHDLFPKKIFTAGLMKSLAPTILDSLSIPIKISTLTALKFNIIKGAKSYLYAFNYNPDESLLDCGDDVFVVQLTDDNIFLFPHPDNEYLKSLNKKETRLAKLMVELFTSFAATGLPEAHSLHEWPPVKLGYQGPYFIVDVIHKLGFDYTEEFFSGLKAQRNDEDILNI